MSISRYDLLNALEEVSRSFDKPWRLTTQTDASQVEGSHWRPATDIREEANQFIIHTDLPGVVKENVQVSMESNKLIIKGERKGEYNNKLDDKNYSRQERTVGVFCRQFTLPETADGEKINASLNNGVLKICIPKRELSHRRIIEIKED